MHIRNMKTLSLTVQKLWPVSKLFVDKHKNGETNQQANKQTGQKVYAPDVSTRKRGPTWLSSKVFDKQSRYPGFEPHRILWGFVWECPWTRHFRAQA